MYPTLFRIPFLPENWADIKSYGAMMMVAFLGGIWFAVRRAERVKADPDVVINMGFIALLAGVIGARAMFVIHYWESRFANQPSPLLAIVDIRAGGLEFWGGPILVIPALIAYLAWTKRSIRWYLDITGPSLMFGLAMARIGCFLNGCCWGSVCVKEAPGAHDQAALPWAVRYPYGSPAMIQQWEFGQLTLPKELIVTLPSGQSLPIPREVVEATREQLDGPARDLREAEQDLEASRRVGADAARIKSLEATVEKRRAAVKANEPRFAMLHRQCAEYQLLPSELRDLSRHYASQPSHPTQLYACVTGLLLYWVLHTLFYYRRRHGVVLGWFFILYSLARVFEEAIRQDNPLDVGGVTISQAISAAMLGVGIVWLLVVQRMPLKSPYATKFELPPEEEASAATA